MGIFWANEARTYILNHLQHVKRPFQIQLKEMCFERRAKKILNEFGIINLQFLYLTSHYGSFEFIFIYYLVFIVIVKILNYKVMRRVT